MRLEGQRCGSLRNVGEQDLNDALADDAPPGDWLTLTAEGGSALDVRRVDAEEVPGLPLDDEADSAESLFFAVEYRDGTGTVWHSARACTWPQVRSLFWQYWRSGRIKRRPGEWIAVTGGPDIPA